MMINERYAIHPVLSSVCNPTHQRSLCISLQKTLYYSSLLLDSSPYRHKYVRYDELGIAAANHAQITD